MYSLAIGRVLLLFFTVLLFAVNIYSTRVAARIQIICTIVKLIALAIIIIGGLVMLGKGKQIIIVYMPGAGDSNAWFAAWVITNSIQNGWWLALMNA